MQMTRSSGNLALWPKQVYTVTLEYQGMQVYIVTLHTKASSFDVLLIKMTRKVYNRIKIGL